MRPEVYKRPNRPARLTVKDRKEPAAMPAPTVPEIVAVDRATECHVTPPDEARRMVEYLGGGNEAMTLEPSAGTGNLVAALFEDGHSQYELCVIERHASLWDTLSRRFKSGDGAGSAIRGFNTCFLDYAKEARGKIEFSRIVMNPPFKNVRQHIAAALSLWGFDGHREKTLVAIVPITYEHPDAETMEELPVDTFSAAKVRAKIIRFHEAA